ncbi:cysteine proteinase [Xylaria sp. CBS 124048]|nr:cysteine proteinase [Xylaria sp. CBS 124048]
MNGNHLPAGQPMPGNTGGAASGPGLNGGRRRPPQGYSAHHGYQPPHRQHQHQHHQHQHHQHQHLQQHAAIPYDSQHYLPTYHQAYYYPPHMAQHYQHAHMPFPQPTYQYQQSPPVHQNQTHPLVVSSSMQHQPPYTRQPAPPPPQPQPPLPPPPQQQQQQHQQLHQYQQHRQQHPMKASFALSPTLLPVTAPSPPALTPPAPASTHSSQAVITPLSPISPQFQDVSPLGVEAEPWSLKSFTLPWLSHPDEPFPSRISKRRRRKVGVATSVELPAGQKGAKNEDSTLPSSDHTVSPATPKVEKADTAASVVDQVPEPSIDPPPKQHMQSASSTPVSAKAVVSSATSTPTKSNKVAPRKAALAVPAVPAISTIPKTSHKATENHEDVPVATPSSSGQNNDIPQPAAETPKAEPESVVASSLPIRAAPKLWSGLFQRSASTVTSSNDPKNPGSTGATPIVPSSDISSTTNGPGSFAKSNASSLAEALRSYQVSDVQKIAFLKPRGLFNTGNMCYMNSVLQALIFCVPFYNFLDQVSKKATYSFKSETPLIEAMVMFMREYTVIDSAVSVDQLRRRLKSEELEQYGDPFTPETVYDAMKKQAGFATMQRGHQQDAEEFLGFLLDALHDECIHVMRPLNERSSATTAANSSTATPSGLSSPIEMPNTSEWLEVGRKQRAAITRSSGHPTALSPISKMFTGQLRSALRVPGLKESVTLEAFRPLQLDIGNEHVHNIVDALKNLAQSEVMQGDFGASRMDKKTTKQILIESLPPVLILHLKRFQFDSKVNGTIKIRKKIDYPLEFELPDEVFSPQKRMAFQSEKVSPKYKLIAAIYHHGKNASGGHYTVDLRRQDGQEWIRLDDTAIRRIRSEDVAQGGVMGDATKPAAWINPKRSANGPVAGNRFEGIGNEDGGDEDGWNKVSAPANNAKKWSSVVNGNGPNTTTPAGGKSTKDNIKDNKDAYLLFYEKI